jgi:uncharacterized protein (TIGR02996 family)
VNERDPFLKALAENEDDTMTRLVYSDWLEERGEHEEADRQRKWPAAKEWLVRFCKDFDDPSSGENSDGDDLDDDNPWSFFDISYEKLVRLGRKAVEGTNEQRIAFFCGANEKMMDALRANSREFWRNWSIVTGIPLPADVADKSVFCCSC